MIATPLLLTAASLASLIGAKPLLLAVVLLDWLVEEVVVSPPVPGWTTVPPPQAPAQAIPATTVVTAVTGTAAPLTRAIARTIRRKWGAEEEASFMGRSLRRRKPSPESVTARLSAVEAPGIG
jgi:hypothetical protein